MLNDWVILYGAVDSVLGSLGMTCERLSLVEIHFAVVLRRRALYWASVAPTAAARDPRRAPMRIVNLTFINRFVQELVCQGIHLTHLVLDIRDLLCLRFRSCDRRVLFVHNCVEIRFLRKQIQIVHQTCNVVDLFKSGIMVHFLSLRKRLLHIGGLLLLLRGPMAEMLLRACLLFICDTFWLPRLTHRRFDCRRVVWRWNAFLFWIRDHVLQVEASDLSRRLAARRLRVLGLGGDAFVSNWRFSPAVVRWVRTWANELRPLFACIYFVALALFGSDNFIVFVDRGSLIAAGAAFVVLAPSGVFVVSPSCCVCWLLATVVFEDERVGHWATDMAVFFFWFDLSIFLLGMFGPWGLISRWSWSCLGGRRFFNVKSFAQTRRTERGV